MIGYKYKEIKRVFKIKKRDNQAIKIARIVVKTSLVNILSIILINIAWSKSQFLLTWSSADLKITINYINSKILIIIYKNKIYFKELMIKMN